MNFMQVNPCFFVPMTLWKIDNPHKNFNDSIELSVYPHPYLYVQYHPYALHWFHPYDLANPCVWIPGVRWSFPHPPCNVVYIEHNIVQSVLYFNIHVVMMYVLYTQTWITFVYSSNSFFSSFQSFVHWNFLLQTAQFWYYYSSGYLIQNVISPLFTSNSFFQFPALHPQEFPTSNCPVLKLLLWHMFIQLQPILDLILPTLYSSLQSWYSQGLPFNITQTFFFMSNFNWYTVLWFVK